MSVNQESKTSSIFVETSNHAGHQISDDYKIANPNPETLDRNGRVEYNSCIWVSDLRKSEEGGSAAV